MRLCFARHGESEANLSRTFSNRDGWHPLTARGVDEAQRLARSLEGERISVLYCSPIARARQTAEIVGQVLGLPAEVADALREWDVGAWEGTSSEEGWAEYAEVVAAWEAGDDERRVSSGESLTEIVARFGGWLGEVTERHRDDDRVLAIAHGGLYHAALPRLVAGCEQGLRQSRPLGHGDMVVVEVIEGARRCLRWGDRILA